MKNSICFKEFCTNPFVIIIWIVGIVVVAMFILSKIDISEKQTPPSSKATPVENPETNTSIHSKLNPYPMLDYFFKIL